MTAPVILSILEYEVPRTSDNASRFILKSTLAVTNSLDLSLTQHAPLRPDEGANVVRFLQKSAPFDLSPGAPQSQFILSLASANESSQVEVLCQGTDEFKDFAIELKHLKEASRMY